MTAVRPSPEVAREHARRVGHRLIAREAANYRAWLGAGGTKTRIFDPIAAGDVAFECEHERLPGDPCPSPDGVWPHPHPCMCWGERRARTPDLLSTLNGKENPMTTSTAPSRDDATPEAPYGYKADGSARKKPAPSAATLAKATAARRANAAKKPKKPNLTAVSNGGDGLPPEIRTALEAIDSRIAKLQRAREALVEAMA